MTVINQDLPIPAEYQEASKRFSIIWNDYVDREEDAKSEFINMINILESNGYTRTKAIDKIVLDHKHLKGFSRMTIYRKLPDDMKRKYESSNIIMLPDNSDVSFDTFEDFESTKADSNKSKVEEDYQLPRPVLNFAKKIELSPNKLRLIAKPRLKGHPGLQKGLVKSIASLPIDKAKIVVAQELRDLDTGALLKSGNSYIVQDSLKEKIDSEPKIEKSPIEYYFEIMDDMQKFLYHITGHKIVKDEFNYSEKHIEYTEKHRIEIIKSLDERTVLALEEELEVVKSGINSMLDIIDKEVISKNNNNNNND